MTLSPRAAGSKGKWVERARWYVASEGKRPRAQEVVWL